MSVGIRIPNRLVFILMILAGLASAHGTGADPGLTGAPGESTCSSCHGNGTSNIGLPGSLQISLVNGSTYTPGQPLTLRITLNDPNARRWGFEITARKASSPLNLLGGFATISGQGTILRPGPSTPSYVTHNTVGSKINTPGPATWDVTWNPPSDNQGAVVFYAAGNAANNNGEADPGDRIYTTTLQVEPAGSGTPTGNRAMPQFVFGGGFESALYFSNNGSSSSTVNVNFLSAEGGPFAVNGAASHSLNIPPRGTVSFAAANIGAIQSGWALIDLPAGVSGYGIFRQFVTDRPIQEAVVAFSPVDQTRVRITWDDSGGLTTAYALINPTGTDQDVTIEVFADDGAKVGELIKNVKARSKVLGVLRNEPPFAAMLGRKGIAEFRVTSGAVSLVALRFQDSGALTAILAADQ